VKADQKHSEGHEIEDRTDKAKDQHKPADERDIPPTGPSDLLRIERTGVLRGRTPFLASAA
jgi:hypothetical protein